MKRKYLSFKMPNALILNSALAPTTRQIAAIMYAHRNALGFTQKSIAEISALSGRSAATVRAAIAELQVNGYVDAAQTYRWSKKHQRKIYGKKVYRCNLSFTGGYTLIPRALLQNAEKLTPAAFCVTLYLVLAAGNSFRAFPSINEISRAIGIAHSTVCRALTHVKQLAQFLVRLCRTLNGKFAASSYHIITHSSVATVCTVCQSRKRNNGLPSIHNSIVNAICRGFKYFFQRRVVPFLANIVKT